MTKVRLTPGSMGLVGLAVDLFGTARVDPGSWATPVWVEELTDDEVRFAEEFFGLHNVRVTVEKD